MRFCLAVLFAWFGCAAAACTFAPRKEWYEVPSEVSADGSFHSAGSLIEGELSGAAIVNLGNGKIGQRLVAELCTTHEILLFADCDAREAILIHGVRDTRVLPHSGGHHASTIDFIQVPIGPIDVRLINKVDELAEVASEHRYLHLRDLDRYVDSLEPIKRFDPYYGCKIYYPNTAGATQ